MLRLPDQLHLEFRKSIKKEYERWLNTPNVELDMKTPAQAIGIANKTGNYSTLWDLANKMKGSSC